MKIHITTALLVSLTASAVAFTSPPAPRSFGTTSSSTTTSSTRIITPTTSLFSSTLEKSTETTKESTSQKKKTSKTQQQQPSSAKQEKKKVSFGEQIANSGLASAAAVATAAVNAAVAMKSLEAPDVGKSYISMDSRDYGENANTALDEDGLPLVYDKDLIEAYWTKERGALNQRWGTFVGKAVPFLTKLTTLFIRDGKIVDSEIPSLSRQARLDLQDLGPTFIKAGQMMSVRPDVLPQSTLDELTKLQDAVIPFDTETAVAQIERELGGPLGQFFTSISEEPVAAASLAQVYLATLNDGKNTRVAVKVQRPKILSIVSKDLYVLRRAAEVFQGLIERFAPQQRTNYVALLNEWAIGFYTELDFLNEASNQRRLRNMLIDKNITKVTVPRVFDEYCTRRILVSEWMDGKKLSMASTEQIAAVTPAAQEAFLTQLFEVGFFHADPHPGNLLLLDTPTEQGAELALIDCGLMASIDETDRDNMISAVIHLANKDYASLVDDFMKLQILPPDSNRAAIIPLMDKALSPYVKGGGAKKYEQELKRLYGMQDGSNMKSQVGGFQAMTQDALTVLNDIPFSIPPYFAILGRAIVTLEGVALTGNPDYGIIMESYPFIARKLLREGRPEIQKALQQVLYSGGGGGDGTNANSSSSGLKLTRLLALLNNAAGAIATQEGAAFVDLDSVPEDGLSLQEGLQFVLSDNAASLRTLLEPEVDNAVDVIARQIIRRAIDEAVVALSPPRPPAVPFFGNILPTPPPMLPKLDQIPIPILLVSPPGSSSFSSTTTRPSPPGVALLTLEQLRDTVAPKLSRDEEIFAIGLAEGAQQFFGDDIGDLIKGERVLSAQSASLLLRTLRSSSSSTPLPFAGNRGGAVTSNTAAQSIIGLVQESVKNLLTVMDRRRAASSSSARASSSKDGGDELWAAVQSLSPSARARLDEIVEELTQRALKRTLERMSKVERLF